MYQLKHSSLSFLFSLCSIPCGYSCYTWVDILSMLHSLWVLLLHLGVYSLFDPFLFGKSSRLGVFIYHVFVVLRKILLSPNFGVLHGANLDRKSSFGGCQFMGARSVSWQCKNQTTVSTSTVEAKYVAASSCYSQVLWIQNQMLDYGISILNTPIFINNNSAISIVNNPVKHSKTKQIEIRFHFIRDCNEKKLIQVLKVHTDNQYADLFTKTFDVGRFTYIITSVGMINYE